MPPEIQALSDESTLDTGAALAEISSDLFGQGEEGSDAGAEAGTGDDPSKPSGVEKTSSQQTDGDKTGQEAAPPASDPSTESSKEVQDTGAPKTWSKEALADWATLPPRAQQEILKREDDFLKGITMYKDRAEVGDRYDKVVEPYRPLLTAENIDPVQMFQSFAANHYLLTRGTEDQKLELAANMIQGYGIDFGKLINLVSDRVIEPVDPRMAALEREIATLKQSVTSRETQERDTMAAQLDTTIQTFAADPAHPYFEELADDMSKLFELGQATTLEEAYEKAVYLNPTTRQKELDRLTAEKAKTLTDGQQQRQDKIARSTAADLSVDQKSRNGTIPVGSIDDTLAETLARINSRG